MPAARAMARKLVTQPAKPCWSAASSVAASGGRALTVERAVGSGAVYGAEAQPARAATVSVMKQAKGGAGSRADHSDLCRRVGVVLIGAAQRDADGRDFQFPGAARRAAAATQPVKKSTRPSSPDCLRPFDLGLPNDAGCRKLPVAVFSATDRSTSELDVRRHRRGNPSSFSGGNRRPSDHRG
jgi:hypothetical protein